MNVILPVKRREQKFPGKLDVALVRVGFLPRFVASQKTCAARPCRTVQVT